MGQRIFAILRTVVFAGTVLAIALWFLPRWLYDGTLPPRANAAGYPFIVAGLLIALRCFWDFAWHGRGTPAPFDPPRRLVVHGLYRWVRNPMYVGMFLIVLGEAILYEAIRWELLSVLGIFWLAITLFVRFYEEPVLRELFGADYVAYCAAVRRWIPRLQPFDNTSAGPLQ